MGPSSPANKNAWGYPAISVPKKLSDAPGILLFRLQGEDGRGRTESEWAKGEDSGQRFRLQDHGRRQACQHPSPSREGSTPVHHLEVIEQGDITDRPAMIMRVFISGSDYSVEPLLWNRGSIAEFDRITTPVTPVAPTGKGSHQLVEKHLPPRCE